MNNQVIVNKVENVNSRIAVKFCVNGDAERYFLSCREFWSEYSDDVSVVPASVGVIAFVCNVLPIVWLTDAELVVPELDEDFYNAIPAIKQGYEGMFPNMSFRGRVSVKKVVKNMPIKSDGSCGAFFSGGVDAFCTLYSHMEEHPVLITLWGADVKFSDLAGWEVVQNHLKQTSGQLDVDSVEVKTNFRMFLDNYTTGELVRDSGDNYWHGFHHGIGILGHGAPVAYVRGLRSIYIASSYTAADEYKCASDPTIDNNVRYCGARVIHDGYELNRQQKIDRICAVAKKLSAHPTLRVCWISTGGHNCCQCEKCLRTIFEILASGEDPAEYGFDVNHTDMSNNRKIVLSIFRQNHTLRYVWRMTQERCRQIPRESLPEWAAWFQTANLDKESQGADITRFIRRRECSARMKGIFTKISKKFRLK